MKRAAKFRAFYEAAMLLSVLIAPIAATTRAAAPARAATPDDCNKLRLDGQSTAARSCYESLARSSSTYLRAEGDWGLHLYQQANDGFRQAVAQNDRSALYRVRWGMLLHERFNNTDAEQLFKEALQRDPKDAEAYYGLALVSADGFDSKAIEWISKAIELDPKMVAAHELAANLALEDSDTADAIQQADIAIQLAPDALDAMAIHAAVELLADRSPDAWFAKISAINPHYGEAYAIVAHHLVLNYRYEDGIAYFRKAVEADPQLWSARSQLGVNLMRLGEDQEARQQLELCYNNDYRDAATVNSLRLLDSEKNYDVFHDGDAILKLNKSEADLLRPYFDQVIQQAMAAYNKKYQMTLSGPVQVEAYSDHDDFAVRTLGMPGLGALGVTFGLVVVMDSPSARKPGEFNWASTLRHEMSHVYILTETNHRVPRWFTEGLAVHEETQANPEWGDPITPDIVVALRDKKLLPVTELDRGFVRPDYDAQVIVSYYQAGRICDYIQDRWGNQKLLDMVHSFSKRTTTAAVIQGDLGMTPAEFDKEFQDWLYKGLGQVPQNFDKWHTALKQLAADAEAHNYDAVLKDGPEVVQLYPQYIYDANAYEFIAQADLAKGNKAAAAAELTDYEHRGGRDPDTLKELATLEQGLGQPQEAAATLNRINWIYPLDSEVHQRLGTLWLQQKNYAGAIREFNAVVDMHPLDKASAEYDLAEAYFDSGQKDKAENSVLASLEAAPDYQPAQKLLLQLHGSQ
ncbi:MAG TPA: tetratricopeptide repeat protein [Candidatus Dormibacteraeota bacterium]|nr:tetratricopeptide repeat protein [Candidatus Dormibacteraeota bacterium]